MKREVFIVLKTEIDVRLKLSNRFLPFWCSAEVPLLVSFVKQVIQNRRSEMGGALPFVPRITATLLQEEDS
jgi:hypothetical protein